MAQIQIADFYKENIKQAQQLEQFSIMLNQQPDPSWVKTHPYIAGHRYLPIDKYEFLLRLIFKQFRIEIINQGQSFNSVWVSVRVHYFHPVTQTWEFHDGIGAAQIQTKKGASVSNLEAINNGALSMAFPLAKTVAIKDACDHFGALFGSDLNRRDTLDYQGESSILATIKKEITPDDLKIWENAKNAFRRDGNLDKVLERCDMSAQNADKLRLECEAEDSVNAIS